jgi:hypothetical protein
MAAIKLLPEYEMKLKQLKENMLKAQEFAEKLPCLAEYIIKHMICDAPYVNLGNKYKSIPLHWGVYRKEYSSESSSKVTNMQGSYGPVVLTHVYINTYSLFGDNNNVEMPKDMTCYFFDKLNSVYYATDDQLESMLERLNDWYVASLITNKENQRISKIEKAERELQRLKDQK